MARIRILFIALFCLISFYLRAQIDSVKTEMRAVWIATIENIDFPDSPTISSQIQKDAFVRLLDLHKKNGIKIGRAHV